MPRPIASVYVDSSVLLRLILRQPNTLSSWPRGSARVTSELTVVECLRTIDRLRVDGLDPDGVVAKRAEVFHALRAVEVLELSRRVLDRAANPLPSPVGTLDAVHLVSAQLWREQSDPNCTFATHDVKLGRAAAALGFPVMGL